MVVDLEFFQDVGIACSGVGVEKCFCQGSVPGVPWGVVLGLEDGVRHQALHECCVGFSLSLHDFLSVLLVYIFCDDGVEIFRRNGNRDTSLLTESK